MGHAHGRFRLIHVLATSALGAVGVHANVFHAQLRDLGILHHRIGVDRSKARVATRVGVERRNAHQAMHTNFGTQKPVGVLSLHFEGDALDARVVGLLEIEGTELEAASLHPAGIEAHEHERPILGLGATGAWSDGQDGVTAVVLAIEHLAQLHVAHVLLKRLEVLLSLGLYLSVAFQRSQFPKFGAIRQALV